jgi:NAD(P) transhydrogenase subunit alpha|tara:strand:+ start:530 stop:1603 length:1074 start_codon:yes stop_codon:yes gene_type:complete
MKIGFLKECSDLRIAITPFTVSKYEKINLKINIENGIGENSTIDKNSFSNFVCVSDKKNLIKNSDIIISVSSDSLRPFDLLKNKILVSNFSGESNKESLINDLKKYNIKAYDLSLIPRTTIAQSMDILSSMANLSGYKAVIKAAELLPRIFPMIITAAGSIKPAKVVVLGAGVAGLQAIATAKRLGAIVEASDPRQAAKEEVLSLGARFIEVEGSQEDLSAGGYAVQQSKEYLDKQKKEVSKRIESADVVITTAQVFGGKSPILISNDLVRKMKKGSVIVDLASSSGGNCELTVDSKIIDSYGVKIVGNSFLASELSVDSSNLFSNNVFNFLNHVIKNGKIINENENSILSSCRIIK